MAYNHEYNCGMELPDSLVSFPNLGEEIKRWLGLNEVTGTKNLTNTSSSGYTQMVNGDGTKIIAYSAVEVGHTVPLHEDLVLKRLGIVYVEMVEAYRCNSRISEVLCCHPLEYFSV
jgi:poly(3-hydroxybutyrate) depolymerase